EVDCSGTCIDPRTDPTFCGAMTDCQGANAGTTCAAGQVCNNGSCSVSCPGTQIKFKGLCGNPDTEPHQCGATPGCGNNGMGSAGNACPSGQVCNTGVCSVSCPGSQINCNGICVDPETDPTHCGATAGCGANGMGSGGMACANGQVCNTGACSV